MMQTERIAIYDKNYFTSDDFKPKYCSGQSITSLGEGPIGILPGKSHIPWVSAV